MSTRNIYVMFDQKNFTKEEIVADLQGEGYEHNFFYGIAREGVDLDKLVAYADEVWCFGECKMVKEYELAKSLGCDIWQMK